MFKTHLAAFVLKHSSVSNREATLRLVLNSLGIGSTNIPAEARNFVSLLQDKDISGSIIDVGSNRGEWTLAVYSYLRNCTFHLVEPQTSLLLELQDALKSSPRNAFFIHNYGLSSHGDPIVLFFPEEGSGAATSFPDDESFYKYSDKVSSKTLSEVLNAVPDCIGMKLDTEGMEWQILSSSKSSIVNSSIQLIQFEFGEKTAKLGQSFFQFFQFFNSMGFSLYRGTETEVIPIDSYNRFNEIHINSIFYARR